MWRIPWWPRLQKSLSSAGWQKSWPSWDQ
jgi:hypothetical protein